MFNLKVTSLPFNSTELLRDSWQRATSEFTLLFDHQFHQFTQGAIVAVSSSRWARQVVKTVGFSMTCGVKPAESLPTNEEHGMYHNQRRLWLVISD